MAAHVSSIKMYLLIFGSLMVLTIATVVVAEFNLGPLNDVVAMAIAVTKAVLVILFFMHVKDSTILTKITVVAGFFWLLIMICMTMMDYATRGWLDTFSAAR